MVVLSAAVLTKNGKVLLARQFQPMSRIRIEGLLAAFPKLIEHNSQHTFVETADVRYLYHPLDQLYLVLITNKQSNIMEDLDTLRLVAKLVPEYCEGHTEAAVLSKQFELTFALDEVVSLGYKEEVTLQQIRTFTEMDSHEEKLQKIIRDSKINDAREEARRKANGIDRHKAEMRKLANIGARGGGGGGSTGYGGYSGGEGRGYGDHTSTRAPEPKQQQRKPSAQAAAPSKGMSLSKKGTKDDFFTKLKKEENFMSVVAPLPGQPAAEPEMSHEGVNVVVEEKLFIELDREGEIQKLDVQGCIKVAIFDPDHARLLVKTNGPLSNFKFRLDPRMDKKKYKAEGVLCLKKPNDSFLVGSDNAAVIIKWRYQSTEESDLPFTLNFWPNTENGRSVVRVDFTHEKEDFEAKNVSICIPCGDRPEVKDGHAGDFHYDAATRTLFWTVGTISAEEDSGSLEFSVPELDEDEFYPISVSLTSDDTYSQVEIESVETPEEEELEFETRVSLQAAKFTIGA